MIIQSKRVWVLDQFIAAQIEIENGKIQRILPYNSQLIDFDYGNLRIVPGFIDIHTHGAYGFDTNDANEAGLRNWLSHLPSEGVTSFCPTTITQSKTVLKAALSNVAKVVENGYDGSEILGIHFEGPFLNPIHKGAQPEIHICKPSITEFKEYQAASNGLIKIVTLACELDEDFALTRYLSQNDIVASIGHSDAIYNEACLAVANGARSMTHVYNGMRGFFHREPGLVGAALRMNNTFGEVICDGYHSSFVALNNFFKAKGKDYGIMISDSLLLKGMPIGTEKLFGGQKIRLEEDSCARLLEGHALAGSTLKINEGLKNLVENALVPFDYALNSCTINPARLLHVDNRKGKIVAGYDADIVVLNDDYTVVQTYTKGIARL